jgi:hypothetical protein
MASPSRQVGGRRADLPAPLRIHPTAAAVFEALERAGVRWSLLRGEQRLESPPHDVDLLVARSDLAAMSSAVQQLGFIPVPTWARGSHRFFVAHLPTDDRWLLLDVVTELAYGPGYAMRTRAIDGCLARRESIGPLAVLSADDAFWALLLHCLLDRDDFPVHQVERLHRLVEAARADGPLARFATAACPPGWHADRILAAVGDDDWDALRALAPQMVARWRRCHPALFWRRSLADRVAWRVLPLHTLLALRGLRVALVSDEPGLAQAVAAGLPGSFYFPVRVLDARSIRPLVIARYHQARGHLVVLPMIADAAGEPMDSRFRPDLVVRLHREDRDLARVRRDVAGLIWRAYGQRRGWSSPSAAGERFGGFDSF